MSNTRRERLNTPHMPPRGRGHGSGNVNIGGDYTSDETEFFAAVDAFKARTGKQFPTLAELLEILKSLGYTRPAEPALSPDRPTRLAR